MKKFVAMLCVAGLLTGCAVSGEKKTDEVKPEAPAQTEETKEDSEAGGKDGDRCGDRERR